MEQTEKERIKEELRAAGITKYGLLKLESRHLPKLIHKDEHIGGIAYGRYGDGSAMIVATDQRVLFLDKIPLFSTYDELTYDVVSGVRIDSQGRFSSVTLHTRLGDYQIRFVNPKAAERFARYIEKVRLSGVQSLPTSEPTPTPQVNSTKQMLDNNPQKTFTSDEEVFLLNHDLATLSTIDRLGKAHGAVVYYIVGEHNEIYLVTKEDTQKVHDILANHQIALTIYDAEKLETMQISGRADLEGDRGMRQTVFQRIVKPRIYGKDIKWPPVTKLQNGSYVVIRITPEDIKFRNFG